MKKQNHSLSKRESRHVPSVANRKKLTLARSIIRTLIESEQLAIVAGQPISEKQTCCGNGASGCKPP
jgi:hypothetical protein